MWTKSLRAMRTPKQRTDCGFRQENRLDCGAPMEKRMYLHESQMFDSYTCEGYVPEMSSFIRQGTAPPKPLNPTPAPYPIKFLYLTRPRDKEKEPVKAVFKALQDGRIIAWIRHDVEHRLYSCYKYNYESEQEELALAEMRQEELARCPPNALTAWITTTTL